MPFDSTILKLDLDSLDKSLLGVRAAYTNLGKAIKDVSSDSVEEAKNLAFLFSHINDTITPQVHVDPSAEVAEEVRTLEEWEKYSRSFASTYSEFKNIPRPSKAHQAAETMLAAFYGGKAPKKAKKTRENVKDTEDTAEETFKSVDSHNKEALEEMGAAWAGILKALDTTMKFVKGTLAKLPGQWEGGFLSGVIGSITLNYQEMDRKRAQMGEMANVFAPGVDSILAPATRKAVGYFARWAEQAQWYYGIAREDVQATVGTLVDTGFTSKQIQQKFDDRMGNLGDNIVVASIAMDRHFNTKTGTTMQDILSLVRDHGMSLRGAGELMVKMGAAGQRSGMGAENYIRGVMQAGAPLSQFGGNLENVAVMMGNISKAYQGMGLDKHYAGAQAVGIAEDLASAFMNISNAMKEEVMRRRYKDTTSSPFALWNRFNDAMQATGTAEGENRFRGIVEEVLKMMREQRGRRSRPEMILMYQQVLNVKNRTAVILEDYADTLFEGGQLKDKGDKIWDQLKQSMDIESTGVNSLEKTRRSLITGMAMIGQGLLGLLTNLVALAIWGLRTLPMLLRGINNNRMAETLSGIGEMNSRLVGRMEESLGSISGGLYKVSAAVGDEFRHVYQPVFDILKMKATKGYREHVLGSLKFAKGELADILFSDEWGEKARKLQTDRDYMEFIDQQEKATKMIHAVLLLATLGGGAIGGLGQLGGQVLKGLMIDKAVDMAKQGMSLDEIEARLWAYYWENQKKEGIVAAFDALAANPQLEAKYRAFEKKLLKTGRYKRDEYGRVRPKLTKEQQERADKNTRYYWGRDSKGLEALGEASWYGPILESVLRHTAAADEAYSY